jgi:hypothetical protein
VGYLVISPPERCYDCIDALEPIENFVTDLLSTVDLTDVSDKCYEIVRIR